jgi:hypothetical protein
VWRCRCGVSLWLVEVALQRSLSKNQTNKHRGVPRRVLEAAQCWGLRDTSVHLLVDEANPVVLVVEAGRALAREVQWWAEHVCILFLALWLEELRELSDEPEAALLYNGQEVALMESAEAGSYDLRGDHLVERM